MSSLVVDDFEDAWPVVASSLDDTRQNALMMIGSLMLLNKTAEALADVSRCAECPIVGGLAGYCRGDSGKPSITSDLQKEIHAAIRTHASLREFLDQIENGLDAIHALYA